MEQERERMNATTEKEAGWIYEPTPEHRCILPTSRDLNKKIVGSIWKCGTCGKEYEVIGKPTEGGALLKVLQEAS
jgi:ribosomal protein L37AE/L43A